MQLRMLPRREAPLPLTANNQSYATHKSVVIIQPFNDNIRSEDRDRMIVRIARSQYTTFKRSTLYCLLKYNRCGLSVPLDIINTSGRPRLFQNNVINILNK